MAKATDALLDIRTQFETMEYKMQESLAQAVQARGMAESASILADVAEIRELMHKLHVKLSK